jgi:hypothetical protein
VSVRSPQNPIGLAIAPEDEGLLADVHKVPLCVKRNRSGIAFPHPEPHRLRPLRCRAQRGSHQGVQRRDRGARDRYRSAPVRLHDDQVRSLAARLRVTVHIDERRTVLGEKRDRVRIFEFC